MLFALPPAGAVSLGRPQGVPLIGRPLQLTVPVLLAASEEPCVRAELVQGDEPVTALQWRLDARSDGAAMLRLSSTAPVQEPVVTVRLTVGCTHQFTQGYVLLAELPTPAREALPLLEPSQPAPAAAGPSALGARPAQAEPGAGANSTLAAASSGPASASTAASPTTRGAGTPASRRRATPANTTGTDPARPSARTTRRDSADAAGPAAKASPAPRAPGTPRLQVDLLDFAIDQAPALKISTELTQPATAALSRGQAQAAWQQLSAPPNEQLAALQRQSEAALAELRSLRELTRRQSEQLSRVSAERDLVRDILAAIAGAVALGLCVLLWRRTRDAAGRPWWQASSRTQTAPREPQPGDSNFVDSSYPEKQLPPPPMEDAGSGWSEFSRPHDAGVRPGPGQAPATAARGTGVDSVMGRSRLPSAEELLDVQEKANFFIAIGQVEQAIQMLESRLLEHLGGSPFLWLDLLDLCRRHGRRDDYERVRQEFQKAFAARLPSFTEAAQPDTEGLELYPRALSRITLLWPTSRVLREIEKSLFEDPAPGSIMFDLEASRDLLLLYSIAHEVVSEQPDGKPYDRTELAALPEGAAEAPVTQPVPLVSLDAKEQVFKDVDLDLDLDFSQLDAPAPAPQAAAPVAAAAVTAVAADALTAPMPIDFGAPVPPAPAVAGELDLVLDDSPPAPAIVPLSAALPPGPASGPDDLQLEVRPPAPAVPTGEQVDTTPPEPPMLADLQLDGLSLAPVRRQEAPEEPLPAVMDLDLAVGEAPASTHSKS
jgi:hypothetical protein